jgi:hypothetical protein
MDGQRGGVFEAVARIAHLGGEPTRATRVAEMRALFESRTGAFAPDDDWFEERSRAFWCDAVTGARFGREIASELTGAEQAWLGPLERAHRGLFRAEGAKLVDVWSGAELLVTAFGEESEAELRAASGQLFDARVAAIDGPLVVALLPGGVFHPRDATAAIAPVLAAGRDRGLSTGEVLDALLRMERALRSLSRVKAAYAYRPDALTPRSATVVSMRRGPKGPT